MVTTSFGLILMVAQAAVGFGHHGRKAGDCDRCGAVSAAVDAEIRTLQGASRWRTRDNAAHALRKFDWRCHPEAALALVGAMLHDCEEEVREEAAESLARLAPCLPEVHLALARAAELDPDHATRKWARRGLRALGDRCQGDCLACDPAPGLPVRVSRPVPTIHVEPLPPLETAPVSPPISPPPPPPADDLPAPLPGASPSRPDPVDDGPVLEGPLSERRRPLILRLGRRR